MGLSQVELAKRMKVTQGVISQWENGYGKPCLENLIELSNILGCSLDELLTKN
jgi:transcriptional regulator with XRE-family HTH domain